MIVQLPVLKGNVLDYKETAPRPLFLTLLVAILRHQVGQMTQPRGPVIGLVVQPRLRIRGRLARGVGAPRADPQPPQRMLLGNSLLQGNVAEHRHLLPILTPHHPPPFSYREPLYSKLTMAVSFSAAC
jgi:hypothetical protein